MDTASIFDWFAGESFHAAEETSELIQREMWTRLALMWAAAAQWNGSARQGVPRKEKVQLPLFANAAIAASRVGSYPCAARRRSSLWPLAHIQGRPDGLTASRKKMRSTTAPFSPAHRSRSRRRPTPRTNATARRA